jgi:CRISPR-associated protein Csx17
MSGQFDLALEGIRPEPLGSYLKALAVLRLVAEQRDLQAAGYWQDDVFHLVSVLDAEGLLRFFSHDYAPTPIIGPWGARSGFFGGPSEKAARRALEAIVASKGVRLASFRDVVGRVRELLRRKGLNEKAKDEEKIELLSDLRNELPDNALPWLDAAYVLGTRNEQGELSRAFPPILGTGGNEGSQGYASTFMQALEDAGVTGDTARAPASALFGLPEGGLAKMASGQFMPGLAGGFNQGHGFDGSSNPMSAWEMVLLFEGAATWASGPSVRQGARAVGRESSPFTVRQQSIGGSVALKDEAKARAELWAPLWERPAHWAEIAALLAEGRMHVGRQPARDTLQMARAASSLGVDRGVASFVRYPILVRNGKSYFAFAVGRFRAGERTESELVGSLETPLARLDAAIRQEKNAPARLVAARRAVSEAVFEVLRAGDRVRATALLRAIGRLDKVLAKWSAGREVNPLSGLSPRWILQATPSTELRLAASIASLRGQRGVGPLRSNLVGVDAARPRRWATGNGQNAWRGATLPDRMASAVSRRLLDGAREGVGVPLWAALPAEIADVAALVDGRTNDAVIEELIHALTWIDWELLSDSDLREVRQTFASDQASQGVWALPRAYSLLKLCLCPGKLGKVAIAPEPSLIPLLLAARLPEACRLAQRRLRSHGLDVVDIASSLQGINVPRDLVRRIAGSLLVPLSGAAFQTLIDTVNLPRSKKEFAR